MSAPTCVKCKKPVVNGYYCCGEHFCSEQCLDKSFEGTGETWDEHYSDDGDCYWSTWETDIARDFEYRNTVSGLVELYATVIGERTVFMYQSLQAARKHHTALRSAGAGYLHTREETQQGLWRNVAREAVEI